MSFIALVWFSPLAKANIKEYRLVIPQSKTKKAEDDLLGRSYVFEREIDEYASMASGGKQRILSHQDGVHILDLGGGKGIAAKQLAGLIPLYGVSDFVYRINKRASRELPNVTVVSYEFDLGKRTENFEPLSGKLFEEITDKALTERFGLVNYIYSYFGVLSYTHFPVEVFQKVHAITSENVLWIDLVGVQSPVHEYRGVLSGRVKTRGGAFYSSVVKTETGDIPLYDWLKKNIKGFHLEWVDTNLIIKKVKEEPFSAPGLRLLEASEGNPPIRIFEQIYP